MTDQLVTISCEFTPTQLDVIQTALSKMINRGRYSKDLQDTWDAVRYQRAYGQLKKRPGTSRTPKSA